MRRNSCWIFVLCTNLYVFFGIFKSSERSRSGHRVTCVEKLLSIFNNLTCVLARRSYQNKVFHSICLLKSSKIFHCFSDCFLFFRRTLGLSGIVRLGLVVILPLNDTTLLLYLRDIQAADLQAAMFKNVILDLPIGCRPSLILHQFLYVHINVDMCYRISQN